MQKNFVERLIYPCEVQPFPGLRLIVLFIFMMLDSINMSMLFAFLPRLVKFFGASELEAGYHAGVIATGFFLARAFFSFIWGYLADCYGRKKILLITSTGLAIFTAAFGLSRNFYMGLVTRLLQGSCAGIDICCMAIMTEMSDETNGAFGMSVLTSSFSAGMVIGPCLGGFLAFPGEQIIDFFPYEPLFDRFPIFLPQVITSFALLLISLVGIIVLRTDRSISNSIDERHPILLHGNQDRKIQNYRTYVDSIKSMTSVTDNTEENGKTIDTFLEATGNVKNYENTPSEENNKMNGVVRMLRSKCFICICVVYTGFSFYGVGFDELFPLFAATKTKYGGFGFCTEQIGLLFTAVGSVLVIVNVCIMPKLVRKRCPKKCFSVFAIIQAASVVLFPALTKIINSSVVFWLSMSTLLLLLRVCMTGCYIAMNLAVCNSIEKEQHGIANGIAFAFSCFGRALAPCTIGSIYSWSLSNIQTIQENKDAMGFPFDNYFSFLIISVVITLCAVMMLLKSRQESRV